MRKLKFFIAFVILLALLVGLNTCSKSVASTDLSGEADDEASARGIILFIGDGMGESHRTAAQWAAHGIEGELVMDSFPASGMVHTAPYGGIGVTDSAAAGTAIATGVKTFNGYIGMDHEQSIVPSILEIAQERGYAVGLVTTTQLGHATPASFAAHVPDRKQMTTIVDQMLTLGVDIILGGGENDFIPFSEEGCFPGRGTRLDDRNLLSEAENADYTVICDSEQLTPSLANSSGKVLGLFGDDGLLDPHTPSLAMMTAFALEALSSDEDGFFLMVEGGQIDWAAHDNDAARVISNTLAFDAAVAEGLNYAQSATDTLIIVTADHETGGMSVSLEDTGKSSQDGPFQMPDGTPFYVTWSTGSHTGADVPITGQGICSENLEGLFENTHIFEVMVQTLDGCSASPQSSINKQLFLPAVFWARLLGIEIVLADLVN